MDQEIRDIVKKNSSKGDHIEELSPMDPPSAYEPPGVGQSVPYEDMHPYLQRLRALSAYTNIAAALLRRGALLAGAPSLVVAEALQGAHLLG